MSALPAGWTGQGFDRDRPRGAPGGYTPMGMEVAIVGVVGGLLLLAVLAGRWSKR